ncbi:hypothetical protein GCM10022221_63130 [Actinocorallia aurea]
MKGHSSGRPGREPPSAAARPGAEAVASAAPAVAETHVATLFFTGDRAYKRKKPVRLPFVDFTTVESRRRACVREVELNRRFAPDVYLGVAEVRDPSGAPCDHLVVMRRMDPARRLSALIGRGEPVEDVLRSIARILVTWHARAPRGARISRQATAGAVRGRWCDNIAELGRRAAQGAGPRPRPRRARPRRSSRVRRGAGQVRVPRGGRRAPTGSAAR